MKVEPKISHPDKVYWPEEGYTKLDLVHFYEHVFPKLKPYVDDRLLSLERCPDGMKGSCFYQKEAPKGMAYVLWAVSPDNQFQQLGRIVNFRGRNEAEIKSETAFDDFGLLLTTEDVGATTATIIKPAGHRVGVIQIIR